MGKVFRFGSGNLYAIDRDALYPTPVKFGTLQEVSQEFSFSDKELHGQNQFPDATARAEGKITCKAKFAQIKGDVLGGLFFGVTPVTGQILPVIGEAGTIPAASGPYTITVAHAAGFRTNLGVIWPLTGVPLTRVTGTPATGQYSVDVATGIYTFAAADATKAVLFDYLYTSALVGKTITITNQEAGISPCFMAILHGTFDTKSVVQILNKCHSNKLTFPYKKGDFGIPEFDFSAAADDADQVGVMSFPE
jgi:hypothetical protein